MPYSKESYALLQEQFKISLPSKEIPIAVDTPLNVRSPKERSV